MRFVAKARYQTYSPYKIRPLADVIRGKDAAYALAWLATYRTQRSEALRKVLASAAANAKSLGNMQPNALIVQTITIDQGPIVRYFKPGAQGRAMPQRRRLCHINIVLESAPDRAAQQEVKRGS